MTMRYLLIFTLAFAACGGQTATPPAGNQILKASNDSANVAPKNPLLSNAAPANLISANASPTVADKSKIKTYDGKGVVTKINMEIGSVELKHDEIKGLMPAMQMEFHVSDKKMLDNLKVGDTVDFVLEDNAGSEQIISIKKAK